MSKRRKRGDTTATPPNGELYRWCLNNTCVLYKQVLDVTATERKDCPSCEMTLASYEYQHDGDDQPPITDHGERSVLGPNGKAFVDLPGKAKLALPPANLTVLPDEEADAVFTTDCDVTGCPVAPKVHLNIPFSLFQTWVWLARRFSVEWLAYLKGTVEGDLITLDAEGMYFPEQVATGVHVEAVPNSVLEGTIASIHSHVDMKAFFSGEDKAHFNHAADLVVNNRGEIEAVVRRQLDCKRYQRVRAEIFFVGSDTDVGAYAALNSKLTIEKPKPVVSTIAMPGTSGYSMRPAPRYAKGEHGIVVLRDDAKNVPTYDSGKVWEGRTDRVFNGRFWEDLSDRDFRDH